VGERFDNPLVKAARAELTKISRELGVNIRDGAPPEYVAAARVYGAVLDALDGVNCQRRDVRDGKRKMEIVK
jgi:hypothetical protein